MDKDKNKNFNQVFLKSADTIGSQLCDKAFWSDHLCGWMGRSMDGTSNSSYVSTNRALGPELYDGTSGISLFLAYLYKYEKKELYRKTAIGAINQSLSLVEDIPIRTYFGFYGGCIGIIYAGAMVGSLLNDSELVRSSVRALIKDIDTNLKEDHLLDVISGNAGAIPALLSIYFNLFRDERILDLAIYLGKELLSSALKESYGWSWNYKSNEISNSEYNLTGFAHGAAGIGYGLLELYYATSKQEFREGAEMAFSYENYWFNEKVNNWPDFRNDSKLKKTIGSKSKDLDSYKYATAWCHGAPGIGLSRLRAYQILGKDSYLKDCKASIETSIRLANCETGSYNESNYSLCHGLTGISELLLMASDTLGNPLYKSVAVNVGINAIDKFMNSNKPWPCGIREGEAPDLMLGLAGIGYYYLRLHDSLAVPSILMVTID